MSGLFGQATKQAETMSALLEASKEHDAAVAVAVAVAGAGAGSKPLRPQ